MKVNCFKAVLLYLLLTCFSAMSIADDSGITNLKQTSKAFSDVAKKASPAVVFIQVEGTATAQDNVLPSPFGNQSPFGDEFFRRFFGDSFPGAPMQPRSPGSQRKVMGQGSGFVFKTESGILSDKAYILTNNHVIENADKITVTFNDGKEFSAEITGRDPQSDVAVIEIDAADIPALNMADSSELEVGEWVVAIGNPFGLSHTLTVGVVSAKGRTSVGINDYEDFIQTDAAINPGNSGGPLVSLAGEVVGINTAIFTRSGGYMGIGFAIPSNLAMSIANQLIDEGEVTRGYLGVFIQPLTVELADMFDIENGKGILVSQVAEDSPAARAGIKAGDVIIQYKGKDVVDVGDFRNRIALEGPEKKVELTILRDGEEKRLSVIIGALSSDETAESTSSDKAGELGITVRNITRELAERYGVNLTEGVLITDVQPGSVAYRAGIRAGQIIAQVNRETINNVDEFNKAIRASKKQDKVLLLIKTDTISRFVVVDW